MSEPTTEITWNPDQEKAIKTIATWSEDPNAEPIVALTGPAGSGKTTLVNALRKHLANAAWSAMTGKAAVRLHQATGVAAKTLHSVLYAPPEDGGDTLRFEEVLPPPAKRVVIDEASMMSPSVYNDLDLWRKAGVKILLIGDGFQLPPIISAKEEEKHGKHFTVFSKVKGPALTQVMRSDSDIINAATSLRNKGIIPRLTLPAYEAKVVADPVFAACSEWTTNPHDHVLITWRNETRMRANHMIRSMNGLRDAPLSPGETICVRLNGQGALNGELYTIKEIMPAGHLGPIETELILTTCGKRLQVITMGAQQYMDGGMPQMTSREWQQFKAATKLVRPLPITYGYCLSGHMAQGSEFDHVTVILPKEDFDNPAFCAMTPLPNGGRAMFAARWSYTAITRARKHVTVLLSR
jgi:hypothetical protein